MKATSPAPLATSLAPRNDGAPLDVLIGLVSILEAPDLREARSRWARLKLTLTRSDPAGVRARLERVFAKLEER